MKRTIFSPATWPISLKIPLVVALLTIVIGSLVTERVLRKLSDIQDQSLKELSGAYLDGISSSVLPHVLRYDIWEVFDTIDRSKNQFENIAIISTIVVSADNSIIAASDPATFATGTAIEPDYLRNAIPENLLKIQSGQPEVRVFRDITYQGKTIGKLIVTLDVSHQLTERRDVMLALIGGNAAFTILLAIFGYFLIRQMLRPFQVLAGHLEKSKDSSFTEISDSESYSSSKEAAELFASYNSMVKAMNERDQLAESLHEEEKLAGLGRLAAAMAHEINNPLGGMLTTLETLRLHADNPEVQKKSFGLLQRGLTSIGDVVQTSLLAYRKRLVKRDLSERDFVDLRRLLRPEIHRRGQNLEWDVTWSGEIPLDGTSVRQIGLNLLLNASSAAGRGGKVVLRSSVAGNDLKISVENDGRGIPADLVHCLNNKGSKRVPLEDSLGIGLWVICRLVDEMKGSIKAVSSDKGTEVTIVIPFDAGAVKHAA